MKKPNDINVFFQILITKFDDDNYIITPLNWENLEMLKENKIALIDGFELNKNQSIHILDVDNPEYLVKEVEVENQDQNTQMKTGIGFKIYTLSLIEGFHHKYFNKKDFYLDLEKKLIGF